MGLFDSVARIVAAPVKVVDDLVARPLAEAAEAVAEELDPRG